MGPVFSHTNRAVGSESRQTVAAVYDEIFDFTFPWYALIAIWSFFWQPVLLRLWLGDQLGANVSLIFAPVIIGCCLTAISNISAAQLSSLNRVGTALIFNILAGLLLATSVYCGWQWRGVVGVAWTFLASRLVLFLQDLRRTFENKVTIAYVVPGGDRTAF